MGDHETAPEDEFDSKSRSEPETQPDPSAIRSLAVSPDDVVNAYIYTQENPGEAVLRVTPPFHGRMRARLHVYRVDDTHMTGALHIRPAELIADDVVDAYPRLEDTVETSVDETDTERLRERHADSHEQWRESAMTAIVETITLETPAGPQQVSIKRLG
ncbi:hypothetical protein [Natronolimnobius baerhuensis]|uniref:hypothetical protein n=1 Tax=Natronolimnobius baerhuensis TaxID=253108 RepID=UPI000B2007B7|nr:hypothetical protein [Natronolimnobius baerhuensis]